MADPENSESLPTQPWTGPAPALGSTAPTPRASPAPSPRAAKWQPPTPEEVQPSFPVYEIRGLLGHGGMGAVYLGWQRSLDRLVAIKILPAQVEDTGGDFAERFKREAKAMARFSHPSIVPVFDAGETPEGLLYFVMEYVEGTDLQKMVNTQGALAPEQALAITTEICDALAYAHDRGVIHRDIKPSNIMVDSGGRVKVADFGLAKMISDEGDTLLTHSHVRMGTPDFMAPEALQGLCLVDHRADLYAVGAMLYQMLTGEVPRGRFELPSVSRFGVDPRFDAIVDHAMQKNPEKRYSSAADLRSDLESIRSQPALPAGPPSETAKGVRSDAAASPDLKRRRGKLSARLGGCSLTLALTFCVALVAIPHLREYMVATVLIPQGHVVFATSTPPPQLHLPRYIAVDTPMDKRSAAGTKSYVMIFDTLSESLLANNLYDVDNRSRVATAQLKMVQSLTTAEDLQATRVDLTESAKSGNLSAMLLLADQVREQEPETAFKRYATAADRGSAPAMTQLGLMFLRTTIPGTPDLAKAAHLFQAAANKGDTGGELALADCYLGGQGLEKNAAKALELYHQAVDGGNVLAMNRLGDLYVHGDLGNVDLPEAFRLFTKAVEANTVDSPDALANLGVLYVNGDTPKKTPDPQKAVALWKQGVEKQNPFCMRLYAMSLENGLAIKKPDLVQARNMYIQAAEAGDPGAIDWCRQNFVPFRPKNK